MQFPAFEHFFGTKIDILRKTTLQAQRRLTSKQPFGKKKIQPRHVAKLISTINDCKMFSHVYQYMHDGFLSPDNSFHHLLMGNLSILWNKFTKYLFDRHDRHHYPTPFLLNFLKNFFFIDVCKKKSDSRDGASCCV